MDHRLKVKALIDRHLRDIILMTALNNQIGFVSLNKIVVSNDYSYADVDISFMDNNANKKSFDKLVKLAPVIRHELSQKLSIYKTPTIRFHLDNRFIIDEKMDELLKKEKKELKQMKIK